MTADVCLIKNELFYYLVAAKFLAGKSHLRHDFFSRQNKRDAIVETITLFFFFTNRNKHFPA